MTKLQKFYGANNPPWRPPPVVCCFDLNLTIQLVIIRCTKFSTRCQVHTCTIVRAPMPGAKLFSMCTVPTCMSRRKSRSLALSSKRKQKYQSGSLPKAKGSNVRGGGTFFVSCSNLGQLSLMHYSFKNLYGHFPRKILSVLILYATF